MCVHALHNKIFFSFRNRIKDRSEAPSPTCCPVRHAVEMEKEGEKREGEKERGVRGVMQVWSLTSLQNSVKNLSSTTNREKSPELWLAYSP